MGCTEIQKISLPAKRMKSNFPTMAVIAGFMSLSIMVSCQSEELDEQTEFMQSTLYEIFETMPPEGGASGPTGDVLSWQESYYLKSFVAGYEATNDVRFLDRIAEHAHMIMKLRDDYEGIEDYVTGEVMPAWGSTKYTDGRNHAWLVHAGMVTFPLARFVYLVKSDESLSGQYGAYADTLLGQLRETVAGYENMWRQGPGEGEGYYISILNDSMREVMPLNQQNAMGRTHVMLWLITGEEQYREHAAGLANYFRNRLMYVENKDAWNWRYHALHDGGGSNSEDVSHAAINVDFAFQCYRAGIVFTEEDMNRFANTLTEVVMGVEPPAAQVNGEHRDNNKVFTDQLGRWLHLAYIDPGILETMYPHLKTVIENENTSIQPKLIAAAYYTETSRNTFEKETPLR